MSSPSPKTEHLIPKVGLKDEDWNILNDGVNKIAIDDTRQLKETPTVCFHHGCWMPARPRPLPITNTVDLLSVPLGQIVGNKFSPVKFIAFGGYSDPWRGPRELLQPEYDGCWLFQDGSPATSVLGSFTSARIHRPDWLNHNLVSTIRTVVEHVQVYTIIEAISIGYGGKPAYQLIKAMSKDEALCQMLSNVLQGISSICVFLYVLPKRCYAPNSRRSLLNICEKFNVRLREDEESGASFIY